MKHTLKVTELLIAIFVLSQIVGLCILSAYCSGYGNSLACKPLPLGLMRLEMQDVSQTFQPVVDTVAPFVKSQETRQSASVSLYLITLILIGTVLLLVLIKLRQKNLSRIWFTLAIFISLTLAFSAFLPSLPSALLALVISIWKVFWPNIFVSNIAEIFIYGGIASLFYLLINIKSASLLLVGISIYDAYAVWKSKHMVKMATFQSENRMFAGAIIPYRTMGKSGEKLLLAPLPGLKPGKGHGARTAILGGGDMAFPLIFAAAVMKAYGVWYALLPIAFSAVAISMLFIKAEKSRFYPAMPFISAGSFAGLLAVWLVRLIF